MSSIAQALSGIAAHEAAHEATDGLDRARLSDIQRGRMLRAMVDEAVERGVANVTVAHVVARSGVSRRTFYEVFADRDECLLAALEDAIERASECVSAAYEPTAPWRDRIRVALLALLSFLDEDGGTARLLIVESLGAGPVALQRRSRVLTPVISVVDEGRAGGKAKAGPAPVTAEGIVGAVLSVLHTRLMEDDPRSFIELTGSLMSMIVLPFEGAAAARQELERPAPKPRRQSERRDADPLNHLGTRLTYRTVCVLVAIASKPGSSNSQIGRAAGITDQGQTSKLLARLCRLGLIVNVGVNSLRGAPNVWALTEKGQAVQGAIAEQTSRA
jgi:AcrR family transcriptional regulator